MNKTEILEISIFVLMLFSCIDIYMKDSFLKYIFNLIVGG
jgi:hypothetical protein